MTYPAATPLGPLCDPHRLAVPAAVEQAVAAYATSEEFGKCKRPGGALNKFRTIGGRFTYDTSVIAPTLEKRREYRTILLDHRASCFSPQAAVATKLHQLSPPLLDLAGFFIAEESYYPWCSGFKHGRHVITARHCFAQQRRTKSPVTVGASMRFATFSHPDRRYEFKIASEFHAADLQFDPTRAQDDWIILELVGDDADAVPALRISEPKQWQELLGIGIDTNRFLLLRLDEILGDGANATKQQLLEARVQFGPLCRLTYVEDNLAFHTCGTDLGVSGAPMLAVGSDNQVDFVGVHVGGAASIGGLCAVQDRALSPNFGVVLPSGVREKLNRASAR